MALAELHRHVTDSGIPAMLGLYQGPSGAWQGLLVRIHTKDSRTTLVCFDSFFEIEAVLR